MNEFTNQDDDEDPAYRDKSEIIITGLSCLYIFIVVFGAVIPLGQQGLQWLKTGTIPHRDLYWLFADVKCAATNWKAKGWDGMDICRQNYIRFSDWVGVDKILNQIFDLNLAVVTVIFLVVFWFLLIFVSRIVYDNW